MDATVQATQFAELVASDRAERFDFARPPLMRNLSTMRTD